MVVVVVVVMLVVQNANNNNNKHTAEDRRPNSKYLPKTGDLALAHSLPGTYWLHTNNHIKYIDLLILKILYFNCPTVGVCVLRCISCLCPAVHQLYVSCGVSAVWLIHESRVYTGRYERSQ